MPRTCVLALLIVLAGCATARSSSRPGLAEPAHLSVSNPTQYVVRVYASRTPDSYGQRLGELAIGGHANYLLRVAGDVYFRLVRLNGRVVRALAHVAPGDQVELEPNLAWSMVFVTIRPPR